MDSEQRGRLIKAFIDVRRCLQTVASQGKLTQGEFLVLRRIKIEHEGNIEKISDFRALRISQNLSMPPPAVSRIFNSLESKGLIQRQINKDNRRSMIVVLTDSGERVLADAEAKVKKFIDEVSDEIGEEDSQRLLILLEKVISIFAQKGFMEGGGLD